MSWFKVDDKFHLSRKLRRLLRLNPAKRRDCSPAGMWLLSGTWCMNTDAEDGFIPADELDAFDDDWQRLADCLVEAELWTVAERKGEKGFQFVNWVEWQPIFELRQARREAGRKGGLASGKARAKQAEASAEASGNQAEASASATKQNEASAEAKRTSTRTYPSHPIPSHPSPSRARAGARGVTPEVVAEIKRLTDGDDEHARKTAAMILDRATGDIANPRAYIVAAINKDPAAYKYQRRPPTKAEECPKHPRQWPDSCAGCAADRIAGDL